MLDMQAQIFQYKKQIADLEELLHKTKRIIYNDTRSAVYEISEDGVKQGTILHTLLGS